MRCWHAASPGNALLVPRGRWAFAIRVFDHVRAAPQLYSPSGIDTLIGAPA